MLTERQMQAALNVFQARMQGLTDEYFRRMGEHIRDIGQLTPSDVHRLQQLRRMNRNLADVKRQLARAARMNLRDLEAVLEEAAKVDDRVVQKITGVKDTSVSLANNEPLRRALRAQYAETAGRMMNLSSTTVESSAYRNAVDAAVTAVQSGAEDYGSAIRRTLRQAGSLGLRVRENGTKAVEYASGLTRRVDTAVRMNVLDAMRRMNQRTILEVGEQFGADGVEIDAHMLCAEDHLPYQGQQYSNEEFQQIQDSLDRPFGEWNCRHTWSPILLGISPPAYSPEQLEAFERFSTEEVEIDGVKHTRYEWSQQMRRMETRIRAEKDTATLARYAGDDALRRQCQGSVERLMKDYERLSDKAGLGPEYRRTYVAGFVDALPVGNNGPSVDTSGIHTASLGNHESVLAGMVGKADDIVQSVWNKHSGDLNVLDAHFAGSAHCEGRDGVKFNIDSVAKGNEYKAPYQTAFHEFGHQIDYLSGKNGLPFSYTYKGDLLAKTAMRESNAHVDNYFRANFKSYYPDLTRQQIILTNPTSRATLVLADNYERGAVNLDQVLQNQQVFSTLRVLAGKKMEQDFCNSVVDRYSRRERVDISDIFEPATKVNFPFGTGHRKSDPGYWYRAGMHGTEIFAEMYSAEIGNHSSLKAIKEFYPETYKVFREILEVIK